MDYLLTAWRPHFLCVLTLLCLPSIPEAQANLECSFFVYDTTPIPLYICMQKEHTKSVRYHCREGTVSYNEWNSTNCTGPLINYGEMDSSRTTAYNCDASPSITSSDIEDPEISDIASSQSIACHLATVDIWSNPVCWDSPYYQLQYVVDVCIPTSSTSSMWYSCDDRGVLQQDYFADTSDCSGSALINNQSILDMDGEDNGINDYCVLMSCHNETYISYQGPSRMSSGKESFWDNPQTPELLFVVGTGVILVGFWMIYGYRKCCRATKEQVDAANESSVQPQSEDKEAQLIAGKEEQLL